MWIDAKTVVGARPWYHATKGHRCSYSGVVSPSWVSAWRCISLLILLVCLNWHLRILAIRPVPGGAWVQCHYVVGQEAIVGCRIRLVWKTFAVTIGILHAHVLNVYVRMYMHVYVYAVNYVFSNSFLV